MLAPPFGDPRDAHAAADAMLRYIAGVGAGYQVWRLDTPDSASLLGALQLPGRTALILVGGPADAAEQLLRWWVALPESGSFHYAQALVEPDDAAKAQVLQHAGFERLTQLAYLERDARFPWVDPPARDGVTWATVAEVSDAEFGRVILETYQGSADCPELSGVRPIDDVLAAHRGAGIHDPALWELIRVDDCAAGCLLLARLHHAPVYEVVYVGVAVSHRGRGLGRLLMQRALQQARERGGRGVSLVVDVRNLTASRLYESFGFRVIGVRDAYWLRFPQKTANRAADG